MAEPLNVVEIFTSIQGETSYAGLPCTFVRTAGCNLDCSYCDTAYARSEAGGAMDVEEVHQRIGAAATRLVCITGGEPLLQASAVCALCERLLAGGRTVLLETNGTQDLAPVPPEVVVVMDVKCPGSGHEDCTLETNWQHLAGGDQVKFVVGDRRDFDWATAYLRRHGLPDDGPEVLLSPAHGRVTPRALAEWILESRLHVRLQLQLHRLLWPDRDRGV